jgi:hypothetical protein
LALVRRALARRARTDVDGGAGHPLRRHLRVVPDRPAHAAGLGRRRHRHGRRLDTRAAADADHHDVAPADDAPDDDDAAVHPGHEHGHPAQRRDDVTRAVVRLHVTDARTGERNAPWKQLDPVRADERIGSDELTWVNGRRRTDVALPTTE